MTNDEKISRCGVASDVGSKDVRASVWRLEGKRLKINAYASPPSDF